MTLTDYQKYYNNIHACCMMLKDYLDSKEGEEFKTLLACAFQDSYDFEESSYGELEIVMILKKVVMGNSKLLPLFIRVCII